MRLKNLGANVAVLITNHGHEILYSYETAVAGYSPLIGHFKSKEHYSKTTSRHINKYLAGVNAIELTVDEIENIVNE